MEAANSLCCTCTVQITLLYTYLYLSSLRRSALTEKCSRAVANRDGKKSNLFYNVPQSIKGRKLARPLEWWAFFIAADRNWSR